MSIRHLRCFLAVAETGSFTLASARMFLTQSSLTATIQQFEEAVGLRLFDRTTRRVAMTEDGARFRIEAEKVLQGFDSAISDLKAFARSQQGNIRIAAAASVIYEYLVQAIREFRESYPAITISLRDAGAEKVEQMLENGELDFAITSKHKGSDDLDYAPLLEDHYGVVCLPPYGLAYSTAPLRWDELAPQDYLAFSTDTGIGTFLARQSAASSLLKAPHDEISSTTSLYAMLSLGDRYSIVPALAARTEAFPNLVFRELTEPVLTRKICLITRRLRSLSPSARRLLDVLLATLGNSQLPPGVHVSPR
ncbi:MAG: LysR substrate-binding domain-containing protein [Lysobacteraceae bacterium]